jgi:acyl carrier protein
VIPHTPWIQQLLAAPLSERGTLLKTCVEAEFRDWLQMSESEPLPLDESYFSLGLTSLGAMEIQQRLEAMLGCRIDSANLYNNPTVGHLVSYLRTEAIPQFFAGAPASRAVSAARQDDAIKAPASAGENRSPVQMLNELLDDLYQP